MKHIVLNRLVGLLAAAWTLAAPLCVWAAEEGPATPGGTPNATPQPAVTTPVASPNPRPKRETYPFRGTVGSVDPAAMTLVLEGRQSRRVVQLTPRTRIEKDGAPATVEAVKTGDAVGGTLRKTAEGKEEALLVRVGPKPESSGSEADSKPKRSGSKDASG